MKKIVFICSHPYSGSSALYESLDLHPKIQGFKSNLHNVYSDPSSLISLTNHSHKMNNRSAIYMDELLYNSSFYVNSAYSKCKFVYVVREPEVPINFLITNENKNPVFAIRQYAFRLRRLCEMARRTPGAILLTWQNLLDGKGMDLIQDYLSIKDPICFNITLLNQHKSVNQLAESDLNKIQDAYERYLFFLKNQKLVFIN